MTAEPLARPLAHNSPGMAVDPADSRFVALASRTDHPDFNCTLHLSGDGGRTWAPAQPIPMLPSGAEKCYAPQIGFGADGTLYYLFVGLHGLGNQPMGAFLTTSADRGRSFSTPQRVLGPHVYMVQMAIDRSAGKRGRIHVAWVQAGSDPTTGGLPPTDNPVLARFSDDGGETFSRPVRVSDRDRTRVVAPALAVGAGGDVHVLYYDLVDDARDYQGLEGPPWEEPWSLVLATSQDGGRRFGRGVVVDDGVVPPERIMVIFTTPPPVLASDHRGRLFAAWWDARNGDWDVFLRRSTDGGRTWGAPLRLNDDPPGNGRHQYLPAVSVAPNGRVDALFYDRRADPENVRNAVAYTYSADGGIGFTANRTVSSETFDSRVGPTFAALRSSRGLFEFGGRLGLVSTKTTAVAAWTDTRKAEPAVIRQDIYAATIRFPSPSGANGALSARAVAPVAAVLLALAAFTWCRVRSDSERRRR